MTGLTYFCVLTQPRTGSEYLISLLQRHPQIVCHRELFNRDQFETSLRPVFRSQLPPIESRDAHPVDTLKLVQRVSQEAYPRRRVIGFKLYLVQAPEVVNHVISDDTCKLIVLDRDDKLAQFTSLHIAQETGRWNAFAADEPRPQHQITVDTKQLDKFIQKQRRLFSELSTHIAKRPNVLRIGTDELDKRLPDVLGFLGVNPKRELVSDRVRQNSPVIRDRIANWDEISDHLAASPALRRG